MCFRILCGEQKAEKKYIEECSPHIAADYKARAVNLDHSEKKQTNKQTATMLYVRSCYIINTKLVVTCSELSRYSAECMSFTYIFFKQTTPKHIYTRNPHRMHQCVSVCIVTLLPLYYQTAPNVFRYHRT